MKTLFLITSLITSPAGHITYETIVTRYHFYPFYTISLELETCDISKNADCFAVSKFSETKFKLIEDNQCIAYERDL